MCGTNIETENSVIFEQLVVDQLVNNSLASMQSVVEIPCLQKPTLDPVLSQLNQSTNSQSVSVRCI